MKARLLQLAAVCVTALCIATFVGTPPVAANPNVGGNNSISAYVGTGGLLLPDSFSGSKATKSAVADCLGCTWRYTIYCMQGANAPCKHAVTSCPRGSLLYRVWFGRTPSTTAVVGSVCWGSSNPVTRRQVEGRVDDYVVRYIPALRPGFDPPGGSLTSVPVIFGRDSQLVSSHRAFRFLDTQFQLPPIRLGAGLGAMDRRFGRVWQERSIQVDKSLTSIEVPVITALVSRRSGRPSTPFRVWAPLM